MPLVMIYWWEGKTEKKKAKIVELISKAFKEVGSEHVGIIIHDIPTTNWGLGGKLISQTPIDNISQYNRLPDES